jgi:putative hydrolase of the HAD superfamily
MELTEKLYTYRHISFDLWLTLIKSNPEFKPKRNLLFKEFFSLPQPIEEVAAAIRKFDVLTNSINEKVGCNFNTFEIYYLILAELNADIETVSAAMLQDFYDATQSLLMQHKPLLLHNSLPNMLKQLHEAGKTMNILSNTAFIKGEALRTVLDHYGIGQYFSFQLYSDETGFSKPATQMYQCAFDAILKIGNVAKHEVLHVGDNAVSDYQGALAFGFDAHLITNKSYA